ncbi:MAG: alanine racemase [Planctomycetota bacterium]|jgi:D-serine deaminase-like pyridoxal phosphate-dependent protein
MITWQDYCVAEPDALETPAMLLFQDVMDHNMRSVCEMVGGGQNLIAHVKTHKSEAVTRKQVEVGIEGFKCATLNELAMALQAGARKAVLSYPQVQERKIERLCDLASSYPDAWIATIVSTPFHLEMLASVAARRKQPLRAMLDLDAGMHRTGVEIGPDAAKLYQEIDAHQFLHPSGFHLYDGHDEFSDVIRREAAAQQHIESLQEFQRQIESAEMPVPCVVAGGSFSFAYYARTEGMYGSPGTFVYWDWGYSTVMPDMPFRWGALILTQVVDRSLDAGTITTDLGSKGVSSDLPLEERACLLGQDTAQLVLQHEEHGIFRISGELPSVGDYLLAVPGHICPTTIRYPGIHVVDTAGEVVDYYLHTARDRL